MAIYDLHMLPPSAFSTTTGYQPFGDRFNSPDGSNWQFATGSFIYSRADATVLKIDDSDAQGETLNDYGSGETTQKLAEAAAGLPAGTVIEDEFEITLTAMVDGSAQEYRLVALSDGGSVLGYTFDGEWPPEGVELSSVWNGTGDSDGQSLSNSSMLAPCFARGVMIATPDGDVAIETLEVGDLVLTGDRGAQPIRWIGQAKLAARDLASRECLRPIRIAAGALGESSPRTDLVVSPQHRIVVRSKVAQRMFGTPEVLVAAKQLCQIDGIDIATDLDVVEYFHMLFDQHEVVFSNGAETESLYPGPEALKAIGEAARHEILTLFPELRTGEGTPLAARLIAPGRRGSRLAARHQQNSRPLVMAA